MSWLSDLADKAENLLNKIDQNAAAVLQEKDKLPRIKFSPSNSDVSTNKYEQLTQVATSKSDLNVEAKSSLKAVSLKKGNKKQLEINESPTRSSTSNHRMKQSNSFAHFTTMNEDEPKTLSDTSSLKDVPVSFNISDNSENTTPLTRSTENLLKFNNNFKQTGDDSDTFVTMENELLKNEISVVNNEVSLLIGKVRKAEKVSEECSTRMKQLEFKCVQMQEEKESMQVRIIELENEVGFSSDGSQKVNHGDVIDSLKSEVQELQKRITQLELTEISLSSQKSELESSLSESQIMCKSLEERWEKAKSELANVQLEWKNYKIRANNTLTMKEKLIEELGGNVGGLNDELVNSLNNQITQLKLERDEAIEEVTKTQNESENKDKEIESLESRLNNFERQFSILKDAFRQEKVAKEMAEHNVNALSKEMKSIQIETANQISSLRSKLRDHQSKETEHLSTQNASNTNGMSVAENGDERIRFLTQALVAKQAALESVTSDRNALRLQLEKTETRYRSDLIKMKNNQPRVINVNDTDDVKARFPLMMQENPWDSHLSRGAKKVYSSLDGFSVRLGVFLRRNPVARIFIISYIILLHLWVCVVLFSYTPEERLTTSYQKP